MEVAANGAPAPVQKDLDLGRAIALTGWKWPCSNGGSGKLDAELGRPYLTGAHNCLAFGEGKSASVPPYLYFGATPEVTPDANVSWCRAHDPSTKLPRDPDEAI